MPEQISRQDRVDRYVRDELSPEETAAFETELLESPAMQKELETVLALRGALALEAETQEARAAGNEANEPLSENANWRRLALAASVALAVFSTVMLWKVGNDAAGLERELQALGQPRTELLTVAVPIMRSASEQTPDVIIQKPAGRAAILLDIELGLAAREQNRLEFALVDPEGATVLAWQSAPAADGRATAVINSEHLPASRLWLQINAGDGEPLERRLLEFRESP